MTFLTNEQIASLCNENLRFHLQQISMSEEEINKVIETIDEFAQLPLVNVASKDDIFKAVEKCENTSK